MNIFIYIFSSIIHSINNIDITGSFLTGTEPGAILKKLCPRELRCLQLCNEDKFLTDYVPKYINTVSIYIYIYIIILLVLI